MDNEIGGKSEICISAHALQRFKERWEKLRGKQLEEEKVLPTLQGLIMKAVSEDENLATAERRISHNGEGKFTTVGPWRLVWLNNTLVTIELKNIGTFAKPKLYYGEIAARFYVRITEEADCTVVEKSVLKDFSSPLGIETVVFDNKPEINAVISFLRFIGFNIEYLRTGTEDRKQSVLNVSMPKEVRKFEIVGIHNKRIIDLETEGERRKFKKHLVGMSIEDCRSVYNFITDQGWISCVEQKRGLIFKGREAEKVLEEAKKRKEAKRLQDEERQKTEEAKLAKRQEKAEARALEFRNHFKNLIKKPRS